MAVYNNIALSGDGALGEALTLPGAPYTFTFTNTNTANPPTGDGTDPFNTNDCYFIMNSNRATYEGIEFTGTGANIGALKGGILPATAPLFTTTVNTTATFNVTSNNIGSGAQIAVTTVNGSFERAVVIRGGTNFASGDSIQITVNELIAGGFLNANLPLNFDLFPNRIDGWFTPSNLVGTYGNTTGDLTTTNFVYNYRNSGSSLEVLTSVGFKLKQTLDTPLAAGVIGSFQFTPTATIQALTYTLQCTGNVSLNIT